MRVEIHNPGGQVDPAEPRMDRFLSDWGVHLSPNGPVLERKRRPSLCAKYVEQAFRRLLKERAVAIDLKRIQKQVASTLRLRPGALKSRQRTRRVIAARQTAMYLCRELTGSSFREIGAFFGRDDSTAIHAYNQIACRAGSDSSFAKSLEKMQQKIAIDAVLRSLRRLQR
jgi:DnaA-like protein